MRIRNVHPTTNPGRQCMPHYPSPCVHVQGRISQQRLVMERREQRGEWRSFWSWDERPVEGEPLPRPPAMTPLHTQWQSRRAKPGCSPKKKQPHQCLSGHEGREEAAQMDGARHRPGKQEQAVALVVFPTQSECGCMRHVVLWPGGWGPLEGLRHQERRRARLQQRRSPHDPAPPFPPPPPGVPRGKHREKRDKCARQAPQTTSPSRPKVSRKSKQPHSHTTRHPPVDTHNRLDPAPCPPNVSRPRACSTDKRFAAAATRICMAGERCGGMAVVQPPSSG